MPIEFMFVRSDFFSNPILLIMNKIKKSLRKSVPEGALLYFFSKCICLSLALRGDPEGRQGRMDRSTKRQKGDRGFLRITVSPDYRMSREVFSGGKASLKESFLRRKQPVLLF